MPAREEPRLERRARRERHEADDLIERERDAAVLVGLLLEDVAEEAAVAVVEVGPRLHELGRDVGRHRGRREHVRVRMVERDRRGGARVLEDDDRPKAVVAPEVEHPLLVGVDDLLERGHGKGRERVVVARRFDHELVCADAVHEVVDAVATPLEVAFDAERGKLVRDHADAPRRTIRATVGRALRVELGRRLGLAPFAEHARAEAHLLVRCREGMSCADGR